MPITSFLHNRTFDPETTAAMSAAFVEVCEAIGLADRADPITELVAERIIKLAETGVRTKTGLYLATLQEFKSNPQ